MSQKGRTANKLGQAPIWPLSWQCGRSRRFNRHTSGVCTCAVKTMVHMLQQARRSDTARIGTNFMSGEVAGRRHGAVRMGVSPHT
jgi:hypothetical protein